MRSKVNPKVAASLVCMFIVAMLCWDMPLLYPVKVFVVLLHELGHGLAAELSGGDMVKIELNSNLGGQCWSRGGCRLLVLPAGYLGSMLFGGMILVGASRTRHDKLISIFIGSTVVFLAVFYVDNLFGIVFSLVFGIFMIASGTILSEEVNDYMLKFIGLTSAMYAIIDIKEDLISRTVPGSDAYAMSKELFFPPVFWGILWILVALVVTAFLVRTAAEG